MNPVRLTAEIVEAFAGTFLSVHYDGASKVPDFHRQVWEMYCSDHLQCACAAPRGHAKSTAFTLDYGLAVMLFREQSYAIILGSSEDMAVESLAELTYELQENEDIIREFGIKRFITEKKTDIIVECNDGYQFRLVARGAGQKIRGRKWRGKRPGLLLFDDVEDDEQVESTDQRKKFQKWFLRAAKQCIRLGGKARGHGTILHENSLLANLMKNTQWKSLCFKAHEGFDDFSNLLWPERYTEAILRSKRQELIDGNDAAGYSAEYLNDPLDNTDAFLRKDDFLPMEAADFCSEKIVCGAADFAVSKLDTANRTALVVGGKCLSNLLSIVDVRVGRWDPVQWVEELFTLQKIYNFAVFWVEGGQIWKSISPFLYREMQLRDCYINIEVINPVKDKATRGRSLQRRHRAQAMRFDKTKQWYEGYEMEMLRFTGTSQATLDDQFDATALLSLGFDNFRHVEVDDMYSEEEEEFLRDSRNSRNRIPANIPYPVG